MKMNFDNLNKQEDIKILPVTNTDDRDSFKYLKHIDNILKYIHNYGEGKSRLEFHLMKKIKDLDYFGNERFYKELWRKNTNNKIKSPEVILYSCIYKNEKDFEIAKNVGI